MEKNCELCQKLFYYNENRKRERLKRFCSGFCAKRFIGLSGRGRKHSEEWKKIMSERNSGMNNPFFGKNHSSETKKKISVKNLWSESDFLIYNFNEQERQIFDGIMISDGSLEKPSRISSRLTLGFKYRQTLERIIDDLENIRFNPIYEYKHIDKRNGNLIVNYFTKSLSSNTLLKEYNRWYKEGIKIVPNDLFFTPLFCYWWYVLDGYLIDDTVNLCTESFNSDDISLIEKYFLNININVKITKRNRIYLNKKETIKFFNYIKDIKVQKEYEYKFK